MFLYILLMSAHIMNSEEPKIFEAIRGIGQHTDMLPIEKGVSLPLIRMEKGDVVVYRLFYYQVVRPHQNLMITAPKYIGKYNLTKSNFIQLKRLESADENELFEIMENRAEEKILVEYSELWDLYDLLIPLFKAGKCEEFDRETITAAKRFMDGYRLYAEGPLLDFYQIYGGEFFSFVERIANYEN